jgi:hypothetical protein
MLSSLRLGINNRVRGSGWMHPDQCKDLPAALEDGRITCITYVTYRSAFCAIQNPNTTRMKVFKSLNLYEFMKLSCQNKYSQLTVSCENSHIFAPIPPVKVTTRGIRFVLDPNSYSHAIPQFWWITKYRLRLKTLRVRTAEELLPFC